MKRCPSQTHENLQSKGWVNTSVRERLHVAFSWRCIVFTTGAVSLAIAQPVIFCGVSSCGWSNFFHS